MELFGINLTGSLLVTGSTDIVNISASYAISSATASTVLGSIESASYALTSSYAENVPNTASWALNAVTASYVSGSSSVSSSYALSSSYADTAQTLLGSVVSASYALTASYADNAGDGGIQFVTSSLYNVWNVDAPPEISSSYDDEFHDSNFDSSKWTEYDPSGKLTLIEDDAGLILVQDTNAGSQVAGIYQTMPAGDWTLHVHMAYPIKALANYMNSGIALWEDPATSSLAIEVFNFSFSAATKGEAGVGYYTAYDTYNSSPGSEVASSEFGMPIYMKVIKSGSTYYYNASSDGLNYRKIWSGTIPFTASAFGLMTENNNTGVTQNTRYFNFRYTGSADFTMVTGRRMELGIPESSSYAVSALSASYAENAGGASSFLDLTDTPGTYTTFADKVVKVNNTADGLTFDETPTGVLISWTTQSSWAIVGDTTSGGTYTTATHYLDVFKPIKIDLISYNINTAGTYSVYLSNLADETQIAYMISSSASLSAGYNDFNMNDYIMWDQQYNLTVIHHGAAVNMKRSDPAGTQIMAPILQITGSLFGGTPFDFAPGIAITGSEFIRLEEYGVSGSFSSSYAISASYAETASYKIPEAGDKVLMFAISDEVTAFTASTSVFQFRMPYDMTFTDARATVNIGGSSDVTTFDINQNGSTALSTKITIDANESSSYTAAAQPAIASSSLSVDDLISIDIDIAATGSKGGKITMIGS